MLRLGMMGSCGWDWMGGKGEGFPRLRCAGNDSVRVGCAAVGNDVRGGADSRDLVSILHSKNAMF